MPVIVDLPKGYRVVEGEKEDLVYRDLPPTDTTAQPGDTSHLPVAIVTHIVGPDDFIPSNPFTMLLAFVAWRAEAIRWQEQYTGLINRTSTQKRELEAWKSDATRYKTALAEAQEKIRDLQTIGATAPKEGSFKEKLP